MKFFADENIDQEIVIRLRDGGHDVQYVCEMRPGTSDEDVLSIAVRDSLILLTADKDFGELVFRLRRASAGVVLLRLPGLSQDSKATLVAQVVELYGEKFTKTFCVITKNRVRIRK